jgi:class 3 adenylate cyclase
MFCDLVDSSPLAQRLGAESYSECVRRYQESCAATVERFGGHVAQVLGDGTLVYFGYPHAHENGAERAVLAGLAILVTVEGVSREVLAALGVELHVRIGVHTGPVVLGPLGSGPRQEMLAFGDTMNIAARVQGQAAPDSVVVSETTMRLVEGLFVTRDLGTPPLKGIADPVRLYEVQGRSSVRSRLAAVRHLVPMVDRTEEGARLIRAWEDAVAGRARVLTIGGEPGLGKSRLVSRFRDQLRGADHHWLGLHCTPFTSAGALHPWIDHLRESFDLSGSEPPEAALSRLRRGVARLGAAAEETAERFARLLDIPLPAGSPLAAEAVELARHRALEVLVAWVDGLAAERPLVLLVEDLHWSDPSTVQWIRLLIARLPDSRILTLLTFRPEFEPPWPPAVLTTVVLPRLERDHARQLAQAAAGGEPVPRSLIDAIVERADGVPLFLEELAKMASESRTRDASSHFEVPATLRDLLMARLDRLGVAKGVAQLGAVIGRDFAHEMVCEIAGGEPLERNLEQLVLSGLVVRTGVPPDAIYGFKHALVQDTAYESLLRRRRLELHRAVAIALAERARRGLPPPPAVLGHHWRGAEEWLAAAEQFLAAGRSAVALAAFEEAVSHYRAGLACIARGRRRSGGSAASCR